jgi:hypothetical protein
MPDFFLHDYARITSRKLFLSVFVIEPDERSRLHVTVHRLRARTTGRRCPAICMISTRRERRSRSECLQRDGRLAASSSRRDDPSTA